MVYYEHQINEKRYKLKYQLEKFNEIYAAINFVDLIGGRINVSEVIIDGGTLNFVTYKDSSVNLFNALGMDKPANGIRKKRVNYSGIT